MSTPEGPINPLRLVGAAEPEIAIAKPDPFASLQKFRVTRDPTIGNVAPLLTALPHHPLSQARDFCRLHPDQDRFWSPPLYFVPVPIKGQKHDTLHIIYEEIAQRYLPGGRTKCLRLALASKPHDVFFLAHVPVDNLDNSWNFTNLTGCETAMQVWVQLTSRKAEGVDQYLIERALSEKAFPPPKWPQQSLEELINVTFAGRMIDREDHPALLRLRGGEQAIT